MNDSKPKDSKRFRVFHGAPHGEPVQKFMETHEVMSRYMRGTLVRMSAIIGMLGHQQSRSRTPSSTSE